MRCSANILHLTHKGFKSISNRKRVQDLSHFSAEQEQGGSAEQEEKAQRRRPLFPCLRQLNRGLGSIDILHRSLRHRLHLLNHLRRYRRRAHRRHLTRIRAGNQNILLLFGRRFNDNDRIGDIGIGLVIFKFKILTIGVLNSRPFKWKILYRRTTWRSCFTLKISLNCALCC